MADTVTITVNGARIGVPTGAMVSSAVAMAGIAMFRRSVTGEPRGPLCGMGICFECRATVDDVPQQRTCQIVCKEGMRVETQR